jgi:glucokinase
MKPFYIGIDMGGTNIRAVVGDGIAGGFQDFVSQPVKKQETAELEMEQNIIKLINDICKKHKKTNNKLAGIGIAMAALFDRNTGDITKWPNNNKWSGFQIKRVLENHYHVPVVLEDDANAAAVGEQAVGAGTGAKDLAYITVSTGIGCGIIINDLLVTGNHGWAGELGHIKVSDEDIICTCGAKGCLQAVASGSAILKKFLNSEIYKKRYNDKQIDLKEVSVLAQEEVADARDVFCQAGFYIGRAIANIAMLLDIPLFILGGGVMEAGSVIWNPIQREVQNSLENKRSISIVSSHLGDMNGAVGALALIKNYSVKAF